MDLGGFRLDLAALVVGLVGLAIGLVILVQDPSRTPTCGGEPMTVEDTCSIRGNTNDVADLSYEEVLAEQRDSRDDLPLLIAGSSVLAASGGAAYVLKRRRDSQDES